MKKQIGSNLSIDPANIAERQINTRLRLLEEKELKKGKALKATEAQKFLLFYHLNFMPAIMQLSIAQNKKDLLVSTMLEINQDNARKYLAEVGKKSKPLLETQSNYNFLVNYFEQLGHEEKRKEVDKIRLRILSNKK